ncbi:MAG: hypothetical protein NW237_03740 [Cyanobacteriota bacterium]|nr:hypothetical protein [Cyanobacteriota bacterium]
MVLDCMENWSIQDICEEALRTGLLSVGQERHLWRLLEQGLFDDTDLKILEQFVEASLNDQILHLDQEF